MMRDVVEHVLHEKGSVEGINLGEPILIYAWNKPPKYGLHSGNGRGVVIMKDLAASFERL